MHLFDFENSYATLPAALHSQQHAQPVADPQLFALNDELVRSLGGDPDDFRTEFGVSCLAGNAVPKGATPLAQAYGGHQFGQWNPGLGDGRALLIGEIVTANGRFDMQLKGSGRTSYSRAGDGRAWIGPVIREYLISEAMAALGVPTTRALAAVTTGENILREGPVPGAILTRIASSHIRVGTFQLQAFRGDTDALRALYDHTVARHFPNASNIFEVTAQMIDRQCDLVARWMSLGFIHGVMNTDNMTVSGETIDYGPCTFMDTYHPSTVLSSIDRQGRYAYGNQPSIAAWNIAQFASSLVPLADDQDAAVETLNAMMGTFQDKWQAAWARHFCPKFGLSPTKDATGIARRFLTIMAETGADFTQTFADIDAPLTHKDYADWRSDWQNLAPDMSIAAQSNPIVIPRLHHIEAVIQSAVANDRKPFDAMLAAVTKPFENHDLYSRAPAPEERVTATFCGT
ncbi:hypothetical protein BVC71_04340 [Marivivens niveibacter]|uniref:Protein nucleotidyltransferase YdiU n=1 Tax=Marivivens niveibacter TaxID=1930667 RepID=A0A251X280_9RHOB|nr:YdiU family protein [Marivivens niveibacter]OUD10722.1 hypothetical protein BVC71_04340 [Marivivens niveibacter]